MSPEFVQNTKRVLPHIQLKDCVLFITWRLAFNLPQYVIDALIERKHYNTANSQNDTTILTVTQRSKFQLEHFYYFDTLLEKCNSDRVDLSQSPILDIVSNTIHNDSGNKYDLYAFCIMPNHIHIVIKPLLKSANEYFPIAEIMRVLKSVTAHKINNIKNTSGKVWQTESYDHVIRDEAEFTEILNYVINNPVKAGFVECWDKWSGTYIDKRFV
jgi:putative transposase